VIDGGSIVTENVGAIFKAGDLQITTENLTMINGAQLGSSTSGVGDSGSIKLTVNGAAIFDGIASNGQVPSGAFTQVNRRANGRGGNIELTAGSLTVTNGAQLGSATQGVGDAGSVKLIVNRAAIFDGTAPNNVQVTSGAFSQVQGGNGKGGNIELIAGSLTASNGAALTVSTFGRGDAGSLKLTVNGAATFDGTNPNGRVLSGAFSQVNRGANGRGGTVELTADSLTVRNGARLSASTGGVGDGGSVRLTVNGAATFDGTAPNNVQVTSGAGSSVSPGAIGRGGIVELTAGSLTVSNGAVLITSTFGRGDAGSVKLTVNGAATFDGTAPNNVQLPGGAGSSVSSGANGKGGTIELTASSLTVTNGAQLTASSTGQGGAGNLDVTARQLRLDNQGSIQARTASGQGGNITLQVQDYLLLRRGSFISATAGTAQAGGDGGNITFNGKFIVAVPNENSDISANAFTGRGGSIEINAQTIFGIQFRPQLTPLSDITASSTFGAPGVVSINTPDVDPSRGLVQLPVDLTDASRLIVQTCPTGDTIAKPPNQFIITGRGGLPPTPREAVNRDAIQVDLVTADGEASASVSQTAPDQNPLSSDAPIVEAQGWQVAADGTLYLVAAAPQSAIAPSRDRLIHCR
jgi:large exoprotein involved in heme utilization and adhesion